VFGLRHVGAGTGTALAGSIEDARIYGRALSVHEIQSLRPNEPSDIKPLAWWDFEGEALKDRAGHFTHHALFGGAKLRGGRLVLDGTGYLVAARSEAAAKQAVLKTADGKTPNIRHWDPDCWLMNDTYYAYSGGGNPQLMKSTDLKNWTFLGDLLHPDFPSNLGASKGEDISCGNMFKIGDKWMLLCINHGRGARYYLGDFKDEKYLPSFHAMMSFGSNQFFAPESVLTHDGRRVMWAWLLNMPIEPTGVQSLPRELELPADGVLRIRPLRELESLRYDRKQEEGITVTSDTVHRLKEVGSDALELEMVVKSPVAKEFGMDVLCDKNGENGLRLAVMAESKTLKVGNAPAPFELKKGEDLTLRVFIDKNLVEVFANDRQAVVAAGKYVPENLAVTLFSHGGDILVKQVKCWKMKSIH